MNVRAFRDLLDAPYWSKEVVVWVGGMEGLAELLSASRRIDLDLVALVPDDEKLPSSRDDRADLMRRQLDEFLRANQPDGKQRVVLVVRNAGLLAKYGVGLQSFYDWFGGTQTMSVLAIDQLKAIELPSTCTGAVKFDPKWLVDYFRSALAKSDKICVEADEWQAA